MTGLLRATILTVLILVTAVLAMPGVWPPESGGAPSSALGIATPTPKASGDPRIQLVLVADGLAEPVAVAAPDDGSDRLFVAERFGRVRIMAADGALLDEPFLDLGAQVQSNYMEQGLLGLAFHPDYQTNGRFFVAYTDYRTNGDTFIMEFRVSRDDPNLADAKSGRLLLAVDQPFVEHNGGTLRFGPDGYLYIGMGDGGFSGDPYDHAQDRSSLLGKILRIDVDASTDLPYGIPPDNPYAGPARNDNPFAPVAAPVGDPRERSRRADRGPRGQSPQAVLSDTGVIGAARPEIWALGLRNPWQFSFDPETGNLYIPDVGQRNWEEINVEVAGSAGGQNYGWDWLEGTHCYPEEVASCPRQQIGTLPVAEYEHGTEHCAIVGIGVHRGESSPAFDGSYFHADFCSGAVWELRLNESGAASHGIVLDTALRIYGAGQDVQGNLYVTASGDQVGPYVDPYASPTGTVWRIVASDSAPPGATLAPLGRVDAATPAATPAAATPGS